MFHKDKQNFVQQKNSQATKNFKQTTQTHNNLN